MMMKTFVEVKVLGHHGIIWGHNISGQGTCHCDDTDMSSLLYYVINAVSTSFNGSQPGKMKKSIPDMSLP